MSSVVEVYRDEFGRQVVRSKTCRFIFWQERFDGFRVTPDRDPRWIIDADTLRSGRIVGDGNRQYIDDVLEGRAMWSGWPPHLFSFVRKHISEALHREGFTAHEGISVVQAMKEMEAEVVEGKAFERKLAKLTWYNV